MEVSIFYAVIKRSIRETIVFAQNITTKHRNDADPKECDSTMCFVNVGRFINPDTAMKRSTHINRNRPVRGLLASDILRSTCNVQ